ncbi:MAG: dihydrodipicolinate synthase family protein, partial [Victivallaceae bacterium]|nr:dihydrodipicolinate synthase family protein [Victivallaceae bacterium]
NLALIAGGQKRNHMNMFPYGCDGYLSTYGRFCPKIAFKYWNFIQKGDLDSAVTVITDYDMPFFELIGTFKGGFDSGIHAALELFGLAGRWRRKPYESASDEEMDRLKGFFRDKKLL